MDVPDAGSFAHLQKESPRHERRAAKVREAVRSASVDGNVSAITGYYVPRSSYSAGQKKKSALRIDTDRARNPPPETRDIPEVRVIGDTLEVLYLPGLETRQVLQPLGVGKGPGGITGVLEQHEAFNDSKPALLGSPKSQNTIRHSALETDMTAPAGATFMGAPLSDTDSDSSREEKSVVALTENTDDTDTDRQDSMGRAEKRPWHRDANGRMVKKRKSPA